MAQNGDSIGRLLFYALLARAREAEGERERGERERASTSAAVADDFRSRMPLREGGRGREAEGGRAGAFSLSRNGGLFIESAITE